MPADRKTPLLQAQKDVDEVVDIMRNNIDKALERDHNISDLESKSEGLKFGAKRFQSTSRSLKNAMWWQDKRWQICCILVVLAIVAIILGVHFSHKDKNK